MKAWCPKCGSGAKFVSQTNRSIDFTEVLFECVNPKCAGTVRGEMTFGMVKKPDAQCFSSSDAALSVAGQASTDC